MSVVSSQVQKYLETYSGKELLKKHSLDTKGIWRVYGEDPNCDMGGYHHNPYLGTFEGTLEDVLEHAVQLARFYSWGGGGKFELQEPPIKVDVESNKRRAALQQELSILEAKAQEIREKLKAI